MLNTAQRTAKPGLIRGPVNLAYAFVERQTNLWKRYWAWELVWLVYGVVNTLAITFIAKEAEQAGITSDASHLVLFLLLGTLVWAYLSAVLDDISLVVTWERWEGTIEHTFMAPVRRATHLVGICAFAMLYGLARTTVVVVVAELLFHLDLSHANVPAALAVLAAATPAMVGVAILASILPLLSPEKGDQMTVAVQGVILLVSGVYYPISVLPWPLQALGRVSPMTYMLDGIRGSLLQGRQVTQLVPELALMLGMGLLLVPAGLLIFGWAERRAKRLGLLKRSG